MIACASRQTVNKVQLQLIGFREPARSWSKTKVQIINMLDIGWQSLHMDRFTKCIVSPSIWLFQTHPAPTLAWPIPCQRIVYFIPKLQMTYKCFKSGQKRYIDGFQSAVRSVVFIKQKHETVVKVVEINGGEKKNFCCFNIKGQNKRDWLHHGEGYFCRVTASTYIRLSASERQNVKKGLGFLQHVSTVLDF